MLFRKAHSGTDMLPTLQYFMGARILPDDTDYSTYKLLRYLCT